jgi:hypothetical protein
MQSTKSLGERPSGPGAELRLVFKMASSNSSWEMGPTRCWWHGGVGTSGIGAGARGIVGGAKTDKKWSTRLSVEIGTNWSSLSLREPIIFRPGSRLEDRTSVRGHISRPTASSLTTRILFSSCYALPLLMTWTKIPSSKMWSNHTCRSLNNLVNPTALNLLTHLVHVHWEKVG